MAATSPYTPNDYQAVDNYRPYDLPVNDIYKAIDAQNRFWDAGAARVKSVYENALNLQLSKEDNIRIRDEFMKNAEKQLTKLSSMDLSDPSVQRQGFGIFRPLLKDEGIVYDDAYTRHVQQVKSDALSYRTKGDGKQYSDTNLSYAIEGYDEFMKSPDRMAGKAAYQNRREYTPFYDPTNELQTIFKECKPSTFTNSMVKGYYIHTYSNESLTAAKINSCLDGGLSDAAKRQLQINGSVTYRNQLPALRDKYVPHLLGTVSQLQEENSAINGVLTNKGNLATLKEADLKKIGVNSAAEITPEFIANLEKIKMANDTRINNLTSTLGRLQKGDFTDISGTNFETIAGAMYSRDWMKNVGEGFSYDFTKNTMKADPIQMMFYHEHEENARLQNKEQFDLMLKQMELKQQLMLKTGNLKTMLGMGTGDDLIEESRLNNATNSPFSSVDKADDYNGLLNKWTGVQGQTDKLNSWLMERLKTFPNGLSADVKDISDTRFQNFWANFKATAASDPEKLKIVNQYEGQLNNYHVLGSLYRNVLDRVDAQVAPEQKVLETAIGSKSIKLDNGLTITAKDIIDAQNGTSQNGFSIVEETGTQPAEINSFAKTYTIRKLAYNGKVISGPLTGYGEPSKVTSFMNEVNKAVGDKNEILQKRRQEFMKNETVLQREGFDFPFLNDNESAFKKRFAQEIGLPSQYIGDLTIGQTDLDGRLVVSLNTSRAKATKEYDGSQVLKNLKNYGGLDNPTVGGDNNSVMLSGISGLDVINEKDFSSIITPYVRSMETRVDYTLKPQSTGYLRSDVNNTSYRLDISKRYDNGFDYVIYDQANESSPVYSNNQRSDALNFFNMLVSKKIQAQVPKHK